MPSFKPKAKKKIVSSKKQQTCTLDSKHNEKMQEFKNIDEKHIPLLRKKRKKLKKLTPPHPPSPPSTVPCQFSFLRRLQHVYSVYRVTR